MKTVVNILLGAWLVLTGLAHLGGVQFSNSGVILAVLGMVTGVLFFFADSGEKLATQIGSILLGLWLVATALTSLFHVRFPGIGIILSVLAVAAGVMVMISRR